MTIGLYTVAIKAGAVRDIKTVFKGLLFSRLCPCCCVAVVIFVKRAPTGVSTF